MNRRSFFGFACGGAVAAPMALVGEKAVAMPAVAKSIYPSPEVISVIARVEGDGGDAYIRQLVRQGVAEAMHDFSQRQSTQGSRRA